MQACRIKRDAPERIGRGKPSYRRVVIARPQIVKGQVRITLLARIQIHIWRAAGLADNVPEGIVVVPIRHDPRGVGQQANAPVAVVSVEAGAGRLALADSVEAIGIDSLHCATDGFFENLGVVSQISVVYKILGRDPTCRLGDAIAVTTSSGGSTYAYDFENRLVGQNSGAVAISGSRNWGDR